MKVAVIGTGYVGLPTGVGFAELGHEVVCVDSNADKIKDLNSGKITLFEEGLEDLFLKNKNNGRIKFSKNIEDVQGAKVIIIAVGTPPHPVSKEADMKYLFVAASEISEYICDYTVVAIKSTVPVGTGDDVAEIISKSNPSAEFDVVSLPEFLREGFAVYDFFNPDRIVIGTDSKRARAVLDELYEYFTDKTTLLYVSRKSSEAIKYASNSFLAVKVHFINEVADFCEKSGAKIEEVAKGMGLDERIGPKFLRPGPGYGGSCFPKDTMAMAQMARKVGTQLNLVEATIKYNDQRKLEMAKRIADEVSSEANPTVAILGLTFKGGTDDVRESPAIEIVCELLNYGIKLRVYDPKGMDNAKSILNDSVYFAESIKDACDRADVCVILTEWEDFKKIDYSELKNKMKILKILDLRNILNQDEALRAGFIYKKLG